ncbi:MAG TPA: FAD-binding monooxygenase [Bradyrhizobium sp.]|nr:FAD-binding monooxygenase [Bradyrhizobium sp.]
MTMDGYGEHAIVIGASMGGLLAARALADVFPLVTVVERDAFPDPDTPRKGVPQGHHAHGLLSRGRRVIEDFFPGWTEGVIEAGGIRADVARDVAWYGHGVALKQVPSDLEGLAASRPVLEGHVRRRLLALPGVRAIQNGAVLGLVANEDRSAVTGVQVRRGDGQEHTITADLVVDASGRGSLTPAWLEALGYERPQEERIEVGIGYTTRLYRRHAGELGGKVAVVVAGNEPNWRNGAILFHSEDCWIVSIGGYFGDHAPDNAQMFAAYAGSFPTPEIHDIVAHAEPLGDFVSYRYPANVRRRYERLTRFPKNFLVFGDAISNFNPIYGQGMTVAAQQAIALRDTLHEARTDYARRFFDAAAGIVDVPWDIAVGNDLRHPRVSGARPAKVRFINWYIGKLYRAAQHDGGLATAFLRVANLEVPPETLLDPAIVARVIRGNLRRHGPGAEQVTRLGAGA